MATPSRAEGAVSRFADQTPSVPRCRVLARNTASRLRSACRAQALTNKRVKLLDKCAESLRWSQDGEYLALTTKTESTKGPEGTRLSIFPADEPKPSIQYNLPSPGFHHPATDACS